MSGRIKDGGPAFPQISELGDIAATSPGMTLRDWFAGQAMAGEVSGWEASTDGHEFNIARRAYAMADAMIAAREASE